MSSAAHDTHGTYIGERIASNHHRIMVMNQTSDRLRATPIADDKPPRRDKEYSTTKSFQAPIAPHCLFFLLCYFVLFYLLLYRPFSFRSIFDNIRIIVV